MTEPSHTILLAEEDPRRGRSSPISLSFDGYEVIEADSRAKALAILATRQPDLLLADVNGETLSLIDAVRRGGRAGQPDRPRHADAGAEPPHRGARPRALPRARVRRRARQALQLHRAAARVRALLRRRRRVAAREWSRLGALRIDLAAREVWIDGRGCS